MGSPLQAPGMKVYLLVCLGLLAIVSLGWGEAAVDKHDELSLKTLEATEVKDQAAGIPSLRNEREAKKGKENNEDKPKRRRKNKRKGLKGKKDKKNTNNGKSVKSKKGGGNQRTMKRKQPRER